MNALSKNAIGAPVVDRALGLELAACTNLLSRDYPAAPEILEAPIAIPIRRRLEARRRLLEVWIASAPRSSHAEIARAVAEMLGSLNGPTNSSTQATVTKYVEVLSDLPAWAAVAACRAIERGEAEGASLDFRPGAARVRDIARRMIEPWRAEEMDIRRVLEAPALEPQDETMRKRIGGLLAGLAAQLRAYRPSGNP